MPLAFMPQHVWEVGASVLALTIISEGMLTLATDWNPGAPRILGLISLLVGLGIGFAAFLVPAEQAGVQGRNQWGGTTGIAFLILWAGLMLALAALRFWKIWRRRR